MPVFSLDRAIEQPQILHNEMIVDVGSVDGSGSTQRHVGIPVKLGTTPGAVQSSAPGVGADSREILGSVGYSDSEIDEFVASNVIGIE
jgi:crotonobetainyl-CoA:carnitine CoA-transferase CaiB-like acyl-CoA transferase